MSTIENTLDLLLTDENFEYCKDILSNIKIGQSFKPISRKIGSIDYKPVASTVKEKKSFTLEYDVIVICVNPIPEKFYLTLFVNENLKLCSWLSYFVQFLYKDQICYIHPFYLELSNNIS